MLCPFGLALGGGSRFMWTTFAALTCIHDPTKYRINTQLKEIVTLSCWYLQPVNHDLPHLHVLFPFHSSCSLASPVQTRFAYHLRGKFPKT
jgi:hypothetical protein